MKARIGSFTSLIVLTGVLAIGVACSKAAADSDLTQDVQSKISTDSGLQGKQLNVQTSGGVVTLSGTVDNDAERTAASRYASSVPGVKQVVNDIQVASPAATMEADEPAPVRQPEPRSEKPRPSTPRSRPVSRPAEVASAEPAPAMAPAQESRPAPAQSTGPRSTRYPGRCDCYRRNRAPH